MAGKTSPREGSVWLYFGKGRKEKKKTKILALD